MFRFPRRESSIRSNLTTDGKEAYASTQHGDVISSQSIACALTCFTLSLQASTAQFAHHMLGRDAVALDENAI